MEEKAAREKVGEGGAAGMGWAAGRGGLSLVNVSSRLAARPVR